MRLNLLHHEASSMLSQYELLVQSLVVSWHQEAVQMSLCLQESWWLFPLLCCFCRGLRLYHTRLQWYCCSGSKLLGWNTRKLQRITNRPSLTLGWNMCSLICWYFLNRSLLTFTQSCKSCFYLWRMNSPSYARWFDFSDLEHCFFPWFSLFIWDMFGHYACVSL